MPIDDASPRDRLTEQVIGAAIEVHRHLGPGLLESAYGAAMEHELLARNIDYASQVTLPIQYKGATLDGHFRIDFIVGGSLVVELKSVEQVMPIHLAQVLTYLRLGGFRRALLINFKVSRLIDGIRRLVN